MKSITETEVEEFAIELFQNSGYGYLNGPDIAPDGSCPERGSYGDVILINRLQLAIEKLNPDIPSLAKDQALKNVLRLPSLDLISNNEAFHKMLTEGSRSNIDTMAVSKAIRSG